MQGNVWLLLPSVADYPALFECTKENCLFSVWEGERGLKGEGGNPALNGVASLSLIRKGVFYGTNTVAIRRKEPPCVKGFG